MVTDWNVYVAFRHAQGVSKGRGYRLPKNWDTHRDKMKPMNLEFLDKTVGMFNTALSNVDLDKYMACGFKVFKNFNYHQFLNKKVINLYTQLDKIEKRNIRINKEKIIESVRFIKDYMKGIPNRNGYNTLQTYCKLKDGNQKMIIKHYLRGKIDNLFMVYCIREKYVILDGFERQQLVYIVNKYRDFIEAMMDIQRFIKKIEGEIL